MSTLVNVGQFSAGLKRGYVLFFHAATSEKIGVFI